MLKSLFAKTILAAAIPVLFAATPLSATTFTYAGAVTTTVGPSVLPGMPSLPPSGTAGTVELVIDDSDPTLTIFDMFNVREFASVSLNVPGWISGSMANNPNPADFFSISTTSFAFGSYGPTSVDTDNGAFVLPSARHSFRIDFGIPLLVIPTTIGELVAALSLPEASGFFSHELEGSAGFIHTRVEFAASDTPVVPLPATAWLLLAGLAMLVLMRGKREQKSV